MAELKALLFDVDGTLADTERDGHRVAFNQAFLDAGLPWVWDTALYGRLLAVTGGKERIRFFIDEFLEDFEPPADLDGFIANLHRAKTEIYTSLLADGRIPLRPGVKRLMQEAKRAGLFLGIATTTTPENVTALLKETLGEDALTWFDVLAAGDVVPAKKPAPDIYVLAVDELGLQPEHCLALEDSTHGVSAARDAGIRSIVVTVNDYTRNQDFSDASLVVDTLGEPGNPTRVLQGSDLGSSYVDLSVLRNLHRAAGDA